MKFYNLGHKTFGTDFSTILRYAPMKTIQYRLLSISADD